MSNADGSGETDPGSSQQTAAEFREAYGLFRGAFKRRSERFEPFQHRLERAAIRDTYDTYLARAVRRTILLALAAVVFQFALFAVGTLYPGMDPLLAAGTVLVVSLVVGIVTFGAYYVYPQVRAVRRRRRIDPVFPHAVLFMYALSEGGVDLMSIMKRLSEAEDEYGEVSHEFRAIVTDVERFNLDPLTAIGEAKRRTPSEQLQDFLDDLMSVIESGGDVHTFLQNRSEDQLETARQRQENFLDTLAALVEGYLTVVFVGPIFLIVVFIIMRFAGSDTLFLTRMVAYVYVPLGILGFLGFVHVLNTQYEPDVNIELPDRGKVDPADIAEDQKTAYLRTKRATTIRQFIAEPYQTMRQRPSLSLFFTVPAAGILWAAFVLTGFVSLTLADPVRTTSALVVMPLLIPGAGMAAAYEAQRRRTDEVKRRFPEMLAGLAGANRNGIRFVECLRLVGRQSQGVLAQYLQKLNADIRATRDIYNALRRFAIEVDVPRVSRVTKILIEGHKSSEDLFRVLEITAEDARERARLDLERTQQMAPYLAFFMIGVLVYLAIALLFVEELFPAVAGTSAGTESLPGAFSSGEGELPVQSFEVALYHSLLIQAFGNGLVIGKLVDNDVRSGFKYALPLVLLVLIGFHIVPTIL